MPPILTCTGMCRFTLPHCLGNGDMLVVLDMLCAYLEHNASLRSGMAANRANPVGYGDFVLSFNMMQTTNGLVSCITEESSKGPHIGGPSPSLTDLVGEDIPPALQPNTTNPPPPEGGRGINPCWAELLEEALCMNIETTKWQREWRNRSISERKAAKCARHTASIPPTNLPKD
ncbi:hypothetical protein DFJ58DRAFT_733144 [Suillus subalutaceus]|uniref:uncharacterized protein n=1 Tax=Suillus subalutaceus TaxID=48586 RepID=UPI001B885BF9|nr:uncharacterized protein DFJ58DRAFT_733144 [Suillus subalutaceus]KAG1839805.1 hypothetical protein DFJ58DRAFT_733144 [Suillus subalutaceus]